MLFVIKDPLRALFARVGIGRTITWTTQAEAATRYLHHGHAMEMLTELKRLRPDDCPARCFVVESPGHPQKARRIA
jgi:hypothetical protein